MSVTIKQLYDWINAEGLSADTVLEIDADGALIADRPGHSTAYLHVGFIEIEEDEYDEPDDIDGEPGAVGDIVFWDDRKPRWILEWQPDNGRVFAIIDADGNVGVAGADELTRDWREGYQRGKEGQP